MQPTKAPNTSPNTHHYTTLALSIDTTTLRSNTPVPNVHCSPTLTPQTALSPRSTVCCCTSGLTDTIKSCKDNREPLSRTVDVPHGSHRVLPLLSARKIDFRICSHISLSLQHPLLAGVTHDSYVPTNGKYKRRLRRGWPHCHGVNAS